LNNKIIILMGVPCSGKSTWARSRHLSTYIVSRDTIREEMFGKGYKMSSRNEDKVSWMFNYKVGLALANHNIAVLDNTHCKEKYLDDLIKRYEATCDIKIVRFPCPLWKALTRNVTRWLSTGKWIPPRVIMTMYKNYVAINLSKYEKYLVH
jgi:predicted kinase